MVVSPQSKDSLSHTVRKLGADVLATDSTGKTILHNLLEARSFKLMEHKSNVFDRVKLGRGECIHLAQSA